MCRLIYQTVKIFIYLVVVGIPSHSQVNFKFSYDRDEHIFSIMEFQDEIQVNLYDIHRGESVYKVVKPLCSKLIEVMDCLDMMDSINNIMYGTRYTSSSDNATLIDFTSTRLHIVEYFGKRFQYQKYLEIGTYKDELFNISKTLFPHCVGVDPQQGGTHRMTSDAFFASNTEMFDIIFIDGSHEANQVFQDIHNSLTVLTNGGTILMHDCNPATENWQMLNKDYPVLNGDTWKAAVSMRLRKDIEIIVVDIDYGVGIIRKRENKHLLSSQLIDYLSVNPIGMLKYNMLEEDRQNMMRLMSYSDMIKWLDEE